MLNCFNEFLFFVNVREQVDLVVTAIEEMATTAAASAQQIEDIL